MKLPFQGSSLLQTNISLKLSGSEIDVDPHLFHTGTRGTRKAPLLSTNAPILIAGEAREKNLYRESLSSTRNGEKAPPWQKIAAEIDTEIDAEIEKAPLSGTSIVDRNDEKAPPSGTSIADRSTELIYPRATPLSTEGVSFPAPHC